MKRISCSRRSRTVRLRVTLPQATLAAFCTAYISAVDITATSRGKLQADEALFICNSRCISLTNQPSEGKKAKRKCPSAQMHRDLGARKSLRGGVSTRLQYNSGSHRRCRECPRECNRHTEKPAKFIKIKSTQRRTNPAVRPEGSRSACGAECISSAAAWKGLAPLSQRGEL